MTPRKVSLYIDLFFCLVLLPLILTLLPVEVFVIKHPVFFFLLTAYLYALYFGFRKLNIPHLMVRRKFWTAGLFLVLCLVVTYLMSHFPFGEDDISRYGTPMHVREHRRMQMVWFLFLVVTGFSLSIELTIELFRQVLYSKEIEAEKNKAQLALYKAQINPHFLFNTLNSLYGLVLVQSENLESAFVKFADMLKYTYYKSTEDVLPVEDEIEYIRQYIDLQALRLNSHTRVTFEADVECGELKISPMLLITFVENCFKYGVSAEKDCVIVIRIRERGGTLSLETENDIMKRSYDAAPGMGMENCRKRLDLLYPGRYSLDMGEVGNHFIVKLSIMLK